MCLYGQGIERKGLNQARVSGQDVRRTLGAFAPAVQKNSPQDVPLETILPQTLPSALTARKSIE